MTLVLVIMVVLVGLFLLGHFAPSYPATTSQRDDYGYPDLLPDLRISAFAPDHFLALDIARAYVDKEPERKAKETEDKLTEVKNRRLKHDEAMYKHYYDQVQEIKLRRMKEGNPVTKKNPIDPDEMPPAPHNPYSTWHSIS